MPLKKFTFNPGINRDQTNYSTEGGWWAANKVRFLSGFPQKIGGWNRYTTSVYKGVCRALYNWIVIGGYNLLAIGTNCRVYVESGGTLHDITPVYKTYTASDTNNCFTTDASAEDPRLVLVTISNIEVEPGNTVIFSGVQGPIGGIPESEFNVEHEVISVITSNTFRIRTTTPAISSETGGGDGITAELLIECGAGTTVGGYGWGAPPWGGNTTPATGWGEAGLTPVNRILRLQYFDNYNKDLVFNIRYGDIYYWTFDKTFQDRAVLLKSLQKPFIAPTFSEVVLVYGEAGTGGVGDVDISDVGVGFSATAGVGTVTVVSDGIGPVVEVFGVQGLGLLGGLTTSSILSATDVPEEVTQILFDEANGFLLAFGCTPFGGGEVNPLLIRWSSQNDPMNWTPSVDIADSTAGYLELQAGSAIMRAVQNYAELLVFTESSIISLQFAGLTNSIFGEPNATIYTQKLISSDISLIGPNAIMVRNNVTYWMGHDKFYVYNGRVTTLPCTLRQHVFDNVNYTQIDQFVAGGNEKYNEVWWFYCSANSIEIDSYVVYNYIEDIWYYGNCDDGMLRTAWLDSPLRNFPQAAGGFDEYIYNHESGNDANGVPLSAYIESSNVDLDDGDQFVLVRRIIPDISFIGSDTEPNVNPVVDFTIMPRNFPGAEYMPTNQEDQTFPRPVSRSSTVPVEQYTNQVFVRARARQMAIKIESGGVKGVRWQFGAPRVDLRADGRRG
jgi:hypothetical protein